MMVGLGAVSALCCTYQNIYCRANTGVQSGAVQCNSQRNGSLFRSNKSTRQPVAQTLAVEHSVMAGDNHFGSFNFFYPTYNLRDLFAAK